MADSPQEFVTALQPYAQQAAAELNVNADVLLAQAALETGWGRHVIHTGDGRSSHNLFNIKADQRWDGERVNVNTLEYRDGLRSEEHTSELQSRGHLVCRLLLEKKKTDPQNENKPEQYT